MSDQATSKRCICEWIFWSPEIPQPLATLFPTRNLSNRSASDHNWCNKKRQPNCISIVVCSAKVVGSWKRFIPNLRSWSKVDHVIAFYKQTPLHIKFWGDGQPSWTVLRQPESIASVASGAMRSGSCRIKMSPNWYFVSITCLPFSLLTMFPVGFFFSNLALLLGQKQKELVQQHPSPIQRNKKVHWMTLIFLKEWLSEMVVVRCVSAESELTELYVFRPLASRFLSCIRSHAERYVAHDWWRTLSGYWRLTVQMRWDEQVSTFSKWKTFLLSIKEIKVMSLCTLAWYLQTYTNVTNEFFALLAAGATLTRHVLVIRSHSCLIFVSDFSLQFI